MRNVQSRLIICIALLAALFTQVIKLNVFAEDSKDIIRQIKKQCSAYESSVKDVKITAERTHYAKESTGKSRWSFYKKGNMFCLIAEEPLEKPDCVKRVYIGLGDKVYNIIPKIPVSVTNNGEYIISSYFSMVSFWDGLINDPNLKRVNDTTLEGKPCYLFESRYYDESIDQNAVFQYWIDKDNLSLLKYIMMFSTPGTSYWGKTVYTYSDFRLVDGKQLIPFKRIEVENTYGVPSVETVIKEYDVNKGVDDSLFEVPGRVR